MTRVLYEAMGPEASKGAFVHYPANTYPGQAKPLADNTHFNPYGAYQISKCIIEGMKKHNKSNLIVAGHMASDSLGFNQILDAWEKQGVEIVRISGIV